MILVFMVNFDQQTTHPYVLQNLFNFLPELRLPLNFSILIFQIYESNLEVPITILFYFDVNILNLLKEILEIFCCPNA